MNEVRQIKMFTSVKKKFIKCRYRKRKNTQLEVIKRTFRRIVKLENRAHEEKTVTAEHDAT